MIIANFIPVIILATDGYPPDGDRAFAGSKSGLDSTRFNQNNEIYMMD